MVDHIKRLHQSYWHLFLSFQKFMVECNFDWLKLKIDQESKSLMGKGVLEVNGKKYHVILSFSPFYPYRYDRIFIQDTTIQYHKDIHLYHDHSLCLYHPLLDQPLFKTLPLFVILPWVSEWITFYEQWKRYGVWLGKEIKHFE